MTQEVDKANEFGARLKSIQKEMLQCFIEICKNERLQYYLLGGTALGAVRHGGFIPWDDDIDVGMPRQDYEKFLVVAPKYLPEYYFLQCLKTEKYCPFNFAKIRDSRTTFIETTVQKIPMNHGVFIDVFPLDGYPAKRRSQKLLKRKVRLLTRRISAVFTLEKRPRRVRFILLSLLSFLLFPGCRGALQARDRLFRKYNYQSCDLVANHCGAWGEKEIMPKDYFGEGSSGAFEGVEVILPGRPDKYLSRLYGDYMTPPPPEKRIGHHDCTVIDLDRPYTYYV